MSKLGLKRVDNPNNRPASLVRDLVAAMPMLQRRARWLMKAAQKGMVEEFGADALETLH